MPADYDGTAGPIRRSTPESGGWTMRLSGEALRRRSATRARRGAGPSPSARARGPGPAVIGRGRAIGFVLSGGGGRGAGVFRVGKLVCVDWWGVQGRRRSARDVAESERNWTEAYRRAGGVHCAPRLGMADGGCGVGRPFDPSGSGAAFEAGELASLVAVQVRGGDRGGGGEVGEGSRRSSGRGGGGAWGGAAVRRGGRGWRAVRGRGRGRWGSGRAAARWRSRWWKGAGPGRSGEKERIRDIGGGWKDREALCVEAPFGEARWRRSRGPKGSCPCDGRRGVASCGAIDGESGRGGVGGGVAGRRVNGGNAVAELAGVPRRSRAGGARRRSSGGLAEDAAGPPAGSIMRARPWGPHEASGDAGGVAAGRARRVLPPRPAGRRPRRGSAAGSAS